MRSTAQFILLFACTVTGSPWDWQQSSHQSFSKLELTLRDLQKQPYFLKVSTIVTVQKGDTAYLPCRVKSLGDFVVTWLKGDSVTVLTVNNIIFTTDKRYSIVHVPRPRIEADDWNLVINSTELVDTGEYFCSVNTEPKLSHSVFLSVKEKGTDLMLADAAMSQVQDSRPNSHVVGSPSMFAVSGDNVQLECRISGLKSPPTSLYWTKNGTVINARVRSGVSLEVERLAGTSKSNLFLLNVNSDDTGDYACMSDVAPPANISLYIAQGNDLRPVLASLSSRGTALFITKYSFIMKFLLFCSLVIYE